MKSHLKNNEEDDNKTVRIIKKWDFMKRKLSVTLKKIENMIGQKDVNRKVVGFMIWLDEAENFLKYHSKESRNTQELLKIKVIQILLIQILLLEFLIRKTFMSKYFPSMK